MPHRLAEVQMLEHPAARYPGKTREEHPERVLPSKFALAEFARSNQAVSRLRTRTNSRGNPTAVPQLRTLHFQDAGNEDGLTPSPAPSPQPPAPPAPHPRSKTAKQKTKLSVKTLRSKHRTQTLYNFYRVDK